MRFLITRVRFRIEQVSQQNVAQVSPIRGCWMLENFLARLFDHAAGCRDPSFQQEGEEATLGDVEKKKPPTKSRKSRNQCQSQHTQ